MASNHICEVCETTDHYKWHGGTVRLPSGEVKHYTDVCDDCWKGVPRQTNTGGVSWESRTQLNLPRGHVLGPEKNGMRGVYDIRKAKKR